MRDIPCSQFEDSVLRYQLFKLTIGSTWFQLKSQQAILWKSQAEAKIYTEMEKTGIVKTLLKENKDAKLVFPDFKIFYMSEMKTVWHWLKDR